MNIRNIKLTYQLYNFFNKRKLKHNILFYKKYNINKKYYSSVSSEDFKNIPSPLNINDENDSAIELPKNEAFNALNEKLKAPLLSWSKNGYAILDSFFTPQEIDTCNAAIEKLIANKEIKFLNNNKLMFAIHHSDFLNKMGNNKTLLQVLNLIMGKKVELFQSINFLKGSQQKTHSDSIHMTTFPYGNLIAIWIALEDIYEASGPLHYYPGSHKLPYVMNRDYGNIGTKFTLGDKKYSEYENHIESVVIKSELKKKIFLAKKGDVLIWHANLLHGGEEVLNKTSTRKSMVMHYYTNDAICFHEISQRPTLKQ
jgi:hypothetical protein